MTFVTFSVNGKETTFVAEHITHFSAHHGNTAISTDGGAVTVVDESRDEVMFVLLRETGQVDSPKEEEGHGD